MGEQKVLWDRVAMALVVVSPLILLMWWLESRFGALIAVMTLGLLSGAAFFMAGLWFNQQQSKSTMENVADFIHEMMQTEKSRQSVSREYARAEAHSLKKQADLQVLDARRIDQLAQQRMKAIAAETPTSTEYEFEDSDIEYFEVD